MSAPRKNVANNLNTHLANPPSVQKKSIGYCVAVQNQTSLTNPKNFDYRVHTQKNLFRRKQIGPEQCDSESPVSGTSKNPPCLEQGDDLNLHLEGRCANMRSNGRFGLHATHGKRVSRLNGTARQIATSNARPRSPALVTTRDHAEFLGKQHFCDFPNQNPNLNSNNCVRLLQNHQHYQHYQQPRPGPSPGPLRLGFPGLCALGPLVGPRQPPTGVQPKTCFPIGQFAMATPFVLPAMHCGQYRYHSTGWRPVAFGMVPALSRCSCAEPTVQPTVKNTNWPGPRNLEPCFLKTNDRHSKNRWDAQPTHNPSKRVKTWTGPNHKPGQDDLSQSKQRRESEEPPEQGDLIQCFSLADARGPRAQVAPDLADQLPIQNGLGYNEAAMEILRQDVSTECARTSLFKPLPGPVSVLQTSYELKRAQLKQLLNEMWRIKAKLIRESRQPHCQAAPAKNGQVDTNTNTNTELDLDTLLRLNFAFDTDSPHRTLRYRQTQADHLKQAQQTVSPSQVVHPEPSSPHSQERPLRLASGRVPYVLGGQELYVLVRFNREKRRDPVQPCADVEKLFSRLQPVLRRVFWSERVAQADLDALSDRDRRILAAVLVKKKLANSPAEVTFDEPRFNGLARRSGGKRSEENLKCVFKHAQKFLRTLFRRRHGCFRFRKRDTQLKQKNLVDLAFYTFYFGEVADRADLPIACFFHPKVFSARQGTLCRALDHPERRPKTISREYINRLRLSRKFMSDLGDFLNGRLRLPEGGVTGIIREYRRLSRDKLVHKLNLWCRLLGKHGSEGGLERILADLGVEEKCKLPWSIREIRLAVEETCNYFSVPLAGAARPE